MYQRFNVSTTTSIQLSEIDTTFVPQCCWHYMFTNPTVSAIRKSLSVPEPTAGSRVLYIRVFHKLYPITKLHGKKLFDVWHQCILCHVTLWKAGVCHRDVSPPNMMWYEIDGKLTSVFIDYDLSSLAEPGPRGNERTDTLPFMALDLLTKKGQRGEVKHQYHHDLESFVWCFAWISLRYKNGALRPARSRPFDEWANLAIEKCLVEKTAFQFYHEAPARSHIDPLLWSLIEDCCYLLYKDSFHRRNPQYLLSNETGEKEKPADTEETESDIDCLLQRFKDTKSWVALSKPSREPSL